ncbi:MAG: pyridoxal-phosphate dependent enzyme [Chloroflexota bacterium]
MAIHLTAEQLAECLAALPRVRLATLPTPLEECPRLGAALGVNLFIKRDDLTGVAFGGNKARGVEFRLAALLAQGADTVVLAREPDSNNARVTIAACRKLGLDVVLIVPDAEPAEWQGSLLINRLLGAEILFAPGGPTTVAAVRAATLRELAARGRRPVDHDAGAAATEVAALAYVDAARELHRQCEERSLHPDSVFVVSEGPTQAGLLLGALVLGSPWQVVGVTYGERPGDLRPGIAQLVKAVATRLGLVVDLDPAAVISLAGYAGPAFKALTPEAREMIALAATTEGLLLDPIYTGKGLAALREEVRQGAIARDSTVVFVHTGGLPALFRYSAQLTATEI